MNLKSFGCSFIFGSELTDIPHNLSMLTPSNNTWPALLSRHLKCGYQCHARPGAGNLQILERVLTQCNNVEDIVVIGWSWIDRFDYVDPTDTPVPNVMSPKTPWKTILPVDSDNLAHTYYKNLHSQYQDKLTTLVYIKTAIDILQQREIKFIMTCIDNLIFETEWQPNAAVSELQKYIWPYITQFENKTFLEWSQDRCFEISSNLHPLDQAHQAAADYMITVFDTQKTNDPTQLVRV